MVVEDYFIHQRTNMAINEAYGVLMANVLFCGFGEEIKTVTITSCNPSEGKTTTAVNLGISLAKLGKKILLIDADLRKPQSIIDFGCKESLGLSDVVTGNAQLEEVTNSTYVKNFYFIGCGSNLSNPAQILESNKFIEFLNTVKVKYDIVILDTPPLGSVIDCAIAASRTDGTLLVIKSDTVALHHVKQAIEQLEKADARLLGAVLNRVSRKEYKNYYKFYNYYSKEKKDIKQLSIFYTKTKDMFRNREKVAK